MALVYVYLTGDCALLIPVLATLLIDDDSEGLPAGAILNPMSDLLFAKFIPTCCLLGLNPRCCCLVAGKLSDRLVVMMCPLDDLGLGGASRLTGAEVCWLWGEGSGSFDGGPLDES